MKIATWNVNGIRARQSRCHAWIQRDLPDVSACRRRRRPRGTGAAGAAGAGGLLELLARLQRLLGRRAARAQDLLAGARRSFVHPHFDMENRIVVAAVHGITVASIYVPNGGKDFEAKMRFLTRWKFSPREFAQTGTTGPLRRPERRAYADGRSSQGAARGHRPAPGRARAAGRHPCHRSGRPRPGDGAADDEALFTWWAPWREMRKRNIGWRLDYIYASGQNLV